MLLDVELGHDDICQKCLLADRYKKDEGGEHKADWKVKVLLNKWSLENPEEILLENFTFNFCGLLYRCKVLQLKNDNILRAKIYLTVPELKDEIIYFSKDDEFIGTSEGLKVFDYLQTEKLIQSYVR